MNDKTRDLLNRLASSTWFENVTFAQNKISELKVETWADAFTYFTDSEFGDFVMAKQRELASPRKTLPRESPINSEWENMVDCCKIEINDFTLPKLNEFKYIPSTLKQRVIDMFKWMIIHAVIETEYSDVIKTHFYRDWCEILLSGHFACYWDGDIEQGQFVVV